MVLNVYMMLSFKGGKRMRMCFKNISEFLTKLDDDICEILGNNETVVVVGDYDFIKKLLNEYLLYINEGEYELVCCNFEMPELDGYDDAFTITFNGNGEIWVTKAYNDFNNKYYIHNADIAYVHEKFVEKWLETNDVNDVVVLSFVDDKKPQCSGENFKLDNDGKGFVYDDNSDNHHFSVIYRGSEKVPEEFIKEMKKLLGM